MISDGTNRRSTVLLILGLLLCFLANISAGSVHVPLEDVWQGLIGGETSRPAYRFIILEYRLPKAITAVLTGSGLAVSGLLMQTLFRNPLAGPFVLGLSSGASLGVAILILGAGTFGGWLGGLLLSNWSLVLASALGSFLVLMAVLAVTLRVKDTMAILIIGLMFGSVTASVVGVLSYFSPAEQLQQYVFWSFGSLGNLSWQALGVLTLCWLFGMILAIGRIKSLNSLLLGTRYAQSMGLRVRRTTLLLIVATSLLAGGITAFAGPIAFVGLAVPHLTRQLVPSADHRLLLPAVVLFGAALMLICDTIAQLPGSEFTLPINAITSLVGAPVVIWLLVRKRKLMF
ncbi:iron ABC transporter permease [Aureitalea marina]|uniref:Iron ABC transporter n=1 Tax=Aureitalea marina TaxID=930804 RepID=A0A2S7KPP6_9FLAO|nr:iron ABC transporter permease [Aureitalea marina]PQB04577.1 iron ABC transporter [Aureitalea marina]